MPNLVREGTFNQKRENRYFCARLPLSLVGATTATQLLGYLPPNALVVDSYFFNLTQSNAATTDVVIAGITENGSELVATGDAKAAGKTGTFGGTRSTGTGVPVWIRHTVTGAKTAGESLLVIEYVEYDKTNGEYTLMP